MSQPDGLVPDNRPDLPPEQQVFLGEMQKQGLAIRNIFGEVKGEIAALTTSVDGNQVDNYQAHKLMEKSITEAMDKAKEAMQEAVKARVTMDRGRWYLRGIYACGGGVLAAWLFAREHLAKLILGG